MSSPTKITFSMLFLGGAVLFALWAIDTSTVERRHMDEAAKMAGFADADELDAAKAWGLNDPKTYRNEVRKRADMKRAEETAAAKVKAEEDERKRLSNEKFQVAVRAAIALRESMKNPDSFKLERVTRMGDGSLCFNYRAANSFNAIIPGQAVFSPLKTAISGSEAFPMLWSKHCKGYGDEVKNVAYALTYYPRR